MALRAAVGEIQCVLASVVMGSAFIFYHKLYHTEVFCQEILNKYHKYCLISLPF